LISVLGGGSPGRIPERELDQIKILKRFEFSDEKILKIIFSE